jgi:hypothetical protein
MPYQPYDTGWIKFVYGALCLTWFLSSNGLPPHLMSVACYNNIFVPFTKLINKLCELLGNVIVLFGSGIIRCESAVFSYFNYIDPVFGGIQYIESIFDNINIDIGPPSYHSIPSNIRRRKTSTGKHLCSYFARKRHLQQQGIIISGSNQSKNDDKPNNPTPCFHPMETYDDNFHPMDDPSCQDNTWYDAISPYWTGGMIWDGAYVLNHKVVSVTTDPICL